MVRVPGAFEIPSAAQHAAATGRFDAVVVPRLSDSRRDAALRVHRAGGRARADGRRRRDGRADGVRRADDQLGRGSARAGRRGDDQQGWEAAAAAVEMATVIARLRHDAASRARERGPARCEERPAPPRPRGGAADPVSVGCRTRRRRPRRRDVLRAAVAGRAAAAGRRPRRSRRRSRATRWRGSTPIDALMAETAAELAARTDGRARSSDPADGGLRADARPGHAAGRRHQRGARAGADVQHRGRGEVHQRHARRDQKEARAHAHDLARRTTAAAARQPRRARQARRRRLSAPVRPHAHDHGARRTPTANERTTSSRPSTSRRRRAGGSSASGRSARRTSS